MKSDDIAKLEEKLRRSEKQYRDLVEASNDLIWAVDAAGHITFVNRQAALAILGYEPEEMLGHLFFEFMPADEVPRALAAFAQTLAGTAHFHYETTFFRKDGVPVDLRSNSIVLRDDAGRAVGASGTSTDITAWKKADRALRQSEERYCLLFERNLAGVLRTSLDGQLLDCNDSLLRMLGYDSRQELFTRTAADFYMRPADRLVLLARLQDNPVLTNFELPLRRKDGTSFWALTNVSRIDQPGGQTCLEGTIVDIDQQKRTLDALRASEAKYRCLIENLEQNIFLKDLDLRFRAVNRRFCEARGCTEAEALGKTDLDFFPRELAEKYRADDMVVLTQGRGLHIVEQNLCHGKWRTVRVFKTPVRDDHGHITGVLGILFDITDQLVLEAQLRQAQKMEAVGQLAGGLAHDFNNLLTVILGNLSFVLGRQDLSLASARDLLRNAEQASLRAAELTQRLLGFSRRSPLRSEPLNLNQAIDETVRFLRPSIDPRIEVQVVAMEDCWLVKADPGMVNQVLMNLALNARDAMPQGGKLYLETSPFRPDEEYLRLHLEAQSGEYVRLRVRDTGVGMAPEIRQRLFEPFFSTKEVGKGTGLGLAMVFGIVKQHLGWIVCESAPGAGTTFDLFLPRCEGEVTPAPAHAVAPVLAGHETILLVDDERMIRNLASMVLRRLGYRVLQAENGLAALDIYRENLGHIDLVLLDGTMPRLSGRDTALALMQMDPRVRVLFSSGYSNDHHDLADCPQIVGFIQKPYRVEELALKVRGILDLAPKKA